jgi:hypothetical protein
VLTVFHLLAAVRKEPASYLDGSPSDRGEQLRSLEALLQGYDLGGPTQDDSANASSESFLAAFGRFLNDRHGWEETSTPVTAIRRHSSSDADAWESFWREAREFELAASTGTTQDAESTTPRTSTFQFAPNEEPLPQAAGMRGRRSP